jgi:leucyl aminopeptidase
MEITASAQHVREVETDAIALGLFEGQTAPLEGSLAEIDNALDHAVGALLDAGDFRGKGNETLVLYTHGRLTAKRVVLVGLGKREKVTLDSLRQAAATAASKARDLGLATLAVALQQPEGAASLHGLAEAITEGALLGLYRFHELKTQLAGVRPDPARLVMLAPDKTTLPAVEAGIHTGRIIAESTCLARDLVNRPANIATPSHLAVAAEEVAGATGLTCRILEKPAMAALGMDLLLSVNQGGNEPARMIILEHNAGRADLPTVVLVGKGITFDTGGISLKPSAGMEAMKGDMGGAAAVLGALRAIALLDLPLHVVGLSPVTENMPDSLATKPGDVISSLKGLTVEIINTDAEGRLILADALTYSGEFGPDAVLDIATLTGSRIIALGDHAAAVLGDDVLIRRLERAGERTAERVWQLPLFEAYGEQLDSDVADLKNVGGREAGTITAGFFLSKFAPDNIPWAHIDIAGLGLTTKDRPYVPKGGTGFGVRLFVEMLRSWGSDPDA